MSQPGGWHQGTKGKVLDLIFASGVAPDNVYAAVDALVAAGMVVVADYYVPTSDELFRDYATLGNAYLQGRINVRWVMCAETHDVLVDRYSNWRYASPPPLIPFALADPQPSPEVLDHTIRTVMAGNLRWNDHATLFGIPIRLDPAARRPMFELVER